MEEGCRNIDEFNDKLGVINLKKENNIYMLKLA